MRASGPARLPHRPWLLALIGVGAAAGPWSACQSRPSSAPTGVCTAPTQCAGRLPLGDDAVIEFHGSLWPTGNPQVRRAVVIVHGRRGDADRYFEHLVAAARVEGRLENVVLIAPRFRARAGSLGGKELHWSSKGWKQGDRSVAPTRLSSFAVMDEILAALCGKSRAQFPALETLVLVGHSAGGQFVQRYLAAGKGCTDPSVRARYVVMNPSSYLYLDARRVIAGGLGIPARSCGAFNRYKYGLEGMNRYMRQAGAARIRANVFEREAYYLVGSDDTKRGKSLDRSCAGDLQGPNRLARHTNYRTYHRQFPRWRASRFEVLPAIGHSAGKMLLHDRTRQILFR